MRILAVILTLSPTAAFAVPAAPAPEMGMGMAGLTVAAVIAMHLRRRKGR